MCIKSLDIRYKIIIIITLQTHRIKMIGDCLSRSFGAARVGIYLNTGILHPLRLWRTFFSGCISLKSS